MMIKKLYNELDILAPAVKAFREGAAPSELWTNMEKRAHEGLRAQKTCLPSA